MAKPDLLRLPRDFEATVKALLQTPPPPAGTAGSRKAMPVKKRKRTATKRKAEKKR